jgi:penicillin amidase
MSDHDSERMSFSTSGSQPSARPRDEAAEPRLMTRPLRDEMRRDRQSASEPGHAGFLVRLAAMQRSQASPRPPRRSRKRSLHLVGRGVTTLIALILATVLLGMFWLRHRMHAALPQIDGQLQVSGLSATVVVSRDAQGVPSIQAQSVDDLLVAQGYITAQDRLWQMDVLRRHGAGELAEILGPGLIEHDRQQRILQMRAAAERSVAALPPDQLHQLEQYARGVNAFIDTHRDRLPVEFAVLHYKPAPWTPTDSMLVVLSMWQDLATTFPTKIAREALATHLAPAVLADLYPVGSWRDRPPTQPPPDLTQEHPEIEQVPLDSTQSRLQQPQALPREIERVADSLAANDCRDCQAGSNNWVVAGNRSASGAPLVSNDMHLGLTAPDIWYEAGLHAKALDAASAALDVTGFTLPGLPFVIVGRNAHVAWGVTAMLGDVQDVRIETTRGQGQAMEFQRADGSWASVAHHRELIRVRGGRDVTMDVRTTQTPLGSASMETPVISDLFPGEKRTLSLAWTAYDPRALEIPALAMDTAASGEQLVAAMSTFGGPTLSVVWGDEGGHIGYHAIGYVPVRGPADRRPRGVLQAIPNPAQAQAATGGSLPDDEESDANADDGSEAAAQPTPPETGSSPEFVAAKPAIDYTIGSAVSYVPVDARDASQLWSGYIPYDQMPAIVDPPNGVLATANARITADDYPYSISSDWADAYRVERITTVLKDRRGLTPADMLAIQNDDFSDFDRTMAEKLAYAIDHAKPAANQDRLKQAADLLRRWDGHMDPGSPAAAIELAARDQLWPMLLPAQIAAHDHVKPDSSQARDAAKLYLWGERTTALEELVTHQPARWLPAGYASWNDLLAAAVKRALDEAHAPGDLSRWTLAAYHPTEIAHPVFGSHGLMARILGVATGSGMQPVRGDAITIRAAGLHFGPSERFDGDLKDADGTLGNVTTGESGNPASGWYLDQFAPWLAGRSFALPLEHPQPVHTLTLDP